MYFTLLHYQLFLDSLPLRNATYGSFYSPILLDNLVCEGSESSLLSCTHNDIGMSNCDHSEDAGVKCNAECEDYTIRLIPDEQSADYFYLNEDDELSDNFFIKDELARGRVEVCVDGIWRAVCNSDSWNNEQASLTCTELNFSPYGEFSNITYVLNA